MGKHNYNMGKFLNRAAVIGNVNAPANITKKKAISTSDTFNAGQDYRNQQGYRLPGLDWIYHIPSPGKAYNKMSEAQQLLFWTTLGCIGGIALGEYVAKGPYKDTAKKTYDKLFTKSGSKAVVGAPAAVVANASVKPTATPATTTAPKYDYYDPEFKVGVIIEGNDQDKNNILNLINTWKEITPNDYKDKYPYAPKRIFVSNDGFDEYGMGSDDYIRLDKSTEMRGKDGNLNNTLIGVAGLRREWNNAKKSKTGIRFATGYDAEVDSNKGFTDYLAMTGLMTQKQADAYLENISKRINPNGTYKN